MFVRFKPDLNMPDYHKSRTKAITAFRISSESFTIRPEDWTSREPHAVWYGVPVEADYIHADGGTSKRCLVEAFSQDGQVLGYLSLPRRYAPAWTQLCYTIVYWLTMWKAWLVESQQARRSRSQPADLAKTCINNAGARFIKYLYIQCLIIDELLRHRMSKDKSDELNVFDEFLIRDRFDWLYTDYDQIHHRFLHYLNLDPVHPSTRAIFSKALLMFPF